MPFHRILFLGSLAAVTALLCLATSAGADMKTADGLWVFHGNDYTADQRTTENRSDPVTLAFYGGGVITRARLAGHIDDHWPEWDVRGDGDDPAEWTREKACAEAHIMFWRFPDSDDATDMFGSDSDTCRDQYHTRFWDDYEHWRDSANHPTRNKWWVGGIHRERWRGVRCRRIGIYVVCKSKGHRITQDWDVSRRAMLRRMGPHCRISRWLRHPQAKGVRGTRNGDEDNINSGWISRISMRHCR